MKSPLTVWFFTTCLMAVGASLLYLISRVLQFAFGSCWDGVIWLASNSGNIRRAFLTLCITIVVPILMFYFVRAVRAGVLWLEAHVRIKRNML